MSIPNIREPEANLELIQRLANLNPDSAPEWGKMNVTQMLAHCQIAIGLAFSKPLKRALVGYLFGWLGKRKFITSDEPFAKNSPTDPRALHPDATDFEQRQRDLTEQVKRYAETGATTQGPHPFFGKLNAMEWDRLTWKHLDHHLRQFGV